ncbi:MAG TPA: hypothetical protein VM889_04110 [Candidatus Thermoplasmatota archaeon]|nr:hypothetical protein [Candidatus Thermoplasmatota archaeon]
MSTLLRGLAAESRLLAASPFAAGALVVQGLFLAALALPGYESIARALVGLFVWGPLLLLGPVAAHFATVRAQGHWSLALASGAPPRRLLVAALVAPLALLAAYLALAAPFAVIILLEAGAWWRDAVFATALGSLFVGAWVVVAALAFATAMSPRTPAGSAALATGASILALAAPHVAEGLADAAPVGALVWATPERIVAVAAGLRAAPDDLHLRLALAAFGLLAAFAVLLVGVGGAPGLDPGAGRAWRRAAPPVALALLVLPVLAGGTLPPMVDAWQPPPPTASPLVHWATAENLRGEPTTLAAGAERAVRLVGDAPAGTGPVFVRFATPPDLVVRPTEIRLAPVEDGGGSARYEAEVTFALLRVAHLGRDLGLAVSVATAFEDGREEHTRLAMTRPLATPAADAIGPPAALLAVLLPLALVARRRRR